MYIHPHLIAQWFFPTNMVSPSSLILSLTFHWRHTQYVVVQEKKLYLKPPNQFWFDQRANQNALLMIQIFKKNGAPTSAQKLESSTEVVNQLMSTLRTSQSLSLDVFKGQLQSKRIIGIKCGQSSARLWASRVLVVRRWSSVYPSKLAHHILPKKYSALFVQLQPRRDEKTVGSMEEESVK